MASVPARMQVALDVHPSWRLVWLAGAFVFAAALSGAIAGVFVADFLLRVFM